MKQLFKILALALLFPLMAMATDNPKLKGKYTKEKKLHKEYSVNPQAGLTVDNSYGNIDIVTWSENRIVIDVVIKTNGNNEDKVQKKLDEIDVEFSGNASKVTAKTVFKGKKNSSWSWWGNNKSNVNMEINYTIKMPITNSVDLVNDYGGINLNILEGQAKIGCDYGQLNIGELRADNNVLSFDYTKNSSIGYIKSGKINADYSGITIQKAEELEISADYTNSDIREINVLNYNSDYGKMSIGTVTTLIGRGDYIPLSVQTLTGSLNVNSDYGSINIDRVKASVNEVMINSEYAGVKIGYEENCTFDFIINLTHAGLQGEDALTITSSSKDYSDKSYAGYFGTKGSGNKMNIRSDYGGVTLKKL